MDLVVNFVQVVLMIVLLLVEIFLNFDQVELVLVHCLQLYLVLLLMVQLNVLDKQLILYLQKV